MKLMKIIEFQLRIMKIIKNNRILIENYENNENHRIPNENHENHETHRNPIENYKKS